MGPLCFAKRVLKRFSRRQNQTTFVVIGGFTYKDMASFKTISDAIDDLRGFLSLSESVDLMMASNYPSNNHRSASVPGLQFFLQCDQLYYCHNVKHCTVIE